MLTSFVLNKLLLFCICCSFPNFSWPRNLEPFICWEGFLWFRQWLAKNGKTGTLLSVQLYEWVDTNFLLLKTNNIWKGFFPPLRCTQLVLMGTNIFQSFLALPRMLSLLPLDVDSLKALEVHKWVTEIFCLSSLFSKASGHCSFDYQRLKVKMRWTVICFPTKTLPNSD